MPTSAAGTDDASGEPWPPTNVFLDTSVLLNYIQQAVERDKSTHLIDNSDIDIVFGVTVKEELENVQERRSHIYEDLLEFLLEEDGVLEEYDPDNRRPYFDSNDASHVRTLQMALSNLDDRAQVQRQVRQYTRSVNRRAEKILNGVLPNALFDQQPGLPLLFALAKVISHEDDRNVVADAALWAAEGENSSNVLTTLDKDHILNSQTDINAVLVSERNEAWELLIVEPDELDTGTRPQ